MKIIISPAKRMNEQNDFFPPEALPEFLEKSRGLLAAMKSLTYEEAKQVWQCNEKLAKLNYQRIQEMNLGQKETLSAFTPALMAYEGIQYQYMSPMTFEQASWEYVQKNLRILSGFYGILAPLDGITPYRLEMQAKLAVNGCADLYEFWGRQLYDSLISKETGEAVILNLASKEYSRCIETYLTHPVRMITCVFGEKANGKVRQKATMAKMARGEMVRFLAEHHIERLEGVKEFNGLGFSYSQSDSDEEAGIYTFIKEEGSSCT